MNLWFRVQVVLAGLGLFTLVNEANAQTPASDADNELPPNPELVTPVPPAPDAVTPVDELDDVVLPKVRLGVNGGLLNRPATTDAVTYEPSFTWGGHVGVVLFPWLDLRATSQVSAQDVSPHDGAWGLKNPGHDPPKLRELVLGASIELRENILPKVAVWGGGGIAWARLSMSRFHLEQPWPADVETRSGVNLQLPLHLGVGYNLGRLTDAIEVALTLEFRYSPILSSSGELFYPQGGQQETVRNDTGQRVEVGGMPTATAPQRLLLGLEVSLY